MKQMIWVTHIWFGIHIHSAKKSEPMASLALFSVQWHMLEKIASQKKAPGAGTAISGCVRRGSTVKYGARGRPSDDTWMTLWQWILIVLFRFWRYTHFHLAALASQKVVLGCYQKFYLGDISSRKGWFRFLLRPLLSLLLKIFSIRRILSFPTPSQ